MGEGDQGRGHQGGIGPVATGFQFYPFGERAQPHARGGSIGFVMSADVRLASQFRTNRLAVACALSCAADRAYALCVIAWRLNGKDRVKHIGRRRLIARVRFGAGSGPLS